MTNQKPIKTRVNNLESKQTPGDNSKYEKVISWGQDDELTERFYRDGIEITRGQYMRAVRDNKPDQIVMDWGDDEQAD